MARAKRIDILIIKVDKLFSFFSSCCFLKEIENKYSVLLSSYRNSRESLGELAKGIRDRTLVDLYQNLIETLYMFSGAHWTPDVFYFLNVVNNIFVLHQKILRCRVSV